MKSCHRALAVTLALVALVACGGDRNRRETAERALNACAGDLSRRAAALAEVGSEVAEETAQENRLYLELNDAQYVRMLYRSILRREPDPDGAKNWEGWLERGATRAWVAWNFVDSAEFKALHKRQAGTGAAVSRSVPGSEGTPK